jgi:hypothetical protein
MGYSHPYAVVTCDVCDEPVEADTTGGLLVFVRAGETVYEEPPLCAHCSLAIGVTAISRWAEEEEEG